MSWTGDARSMGFPIEKSPRQCGVTSRKKPSTDKSLSKKHLQ